MNAILILGIEGVQVIIALFEPLALIYVSLVTRPVPFSPALGVP